jgi:hypothetical protein
MATAFDAVGPSSAGQSGTGVTSITWTHTVATGPAAVAVGAAASSGAQTAATCAGTAMTVLGYSGATTGSTLLGIANIAAGAKTMAVTVGSAADLEAGSISYKGADTSAPFGTGVTSANTGSVTSASVTVGGTAATSMVTGTVATGSGVTSVTAGTSRWIKNQNTNSGAGNAGGADLAGGGAGTITWAITSDQYGAVAAEVKTAAAGGAGILPQQLKRRMPAVFTRLITQKQSGVYSR